MRHRLCRIVTMMPLFMERTIMRLIIIITRMSLHRDLPLTKTRCIIMQLREFLIQQLPYSTSCFRP